MAVGEASSSADLGGRDAVALLAGLAVAVCLWWLYFDVVALVAERVLRRAEGVERVRLARDSYTYLHFPMVAGIVFVAVGLVVLILGEDHLAQGRAALYGGLVVYLVGQMLFRLRNVGGVNPGRAVLVVGLLVGIAALGPASSLVQVAAPAGALVALVAWEVWAFRDTRDEIRHGEGPAVNAQVGASKRYRSSTSWKRRTHDSWRRFHRRPGPLVCRPCWMRSKFPRSWFTTRPQSWAWGSGTTTISGTGVSAAPSARSSSVQISKRQESGSSPFGRTR